jgi:hypothetical protein
MSISAVNDLYQLSVLKLASAEAAELIKGDVGG